MVVEGLRSAPSPMANCGIRRWRAGPTPLDELDAFLSFCQCLLGLCGSLEATTAAFGTGPSDDGTAPPRSNHTQTLPDRPVVDKTGMRSPKTDRTSADGGWSYVGQDLLLFEFLIRQRVIIAQQNKQG
jgi:hypothetical protein